MKIKSEPLQRVCWIKLDYEKQTNSGIGAESALLNEPLVIVGTFKSVNDSKCFRGKASASAH